MSNVKSLKNWDSLTGIEQQMIGFIGVKRLHEIEPNEGEKVTAGKEIKCYQCNNRVFLRETEEVNEKSIYSKKLKYDFDIVYLREKYYIGQCNSCNEVYYQILESKIRGH